ncbi:MAG: type II toxin-antitoxin system RelB/DinJ family antitoxin [Mycoplasmataceae bacterium]|jgi:DNA-damage-inducible protein J|nr:type II toxin-antitoxin system RelB/DinJ family antitoxin [Mycoplasmataceae bacterium]
MEQILVNFRINKSDKIEMEKICNDLGISLSAAYNIFTKKMVKEKEIPFRVSQKQEMFSYANVIRILENFDRDVSSGNYPYNKELLKALEDYKKNPKSGKLMTMKEAEKFLNE